MKAVGIDKNLAEKIKLNFDEILSGKINNLLEIEIKKTKISLDIIIKIVNARIEEIIEHIFKKIIYCKSLNKSARQIIINGGGSELPIFKRKLSKKLNTSVEYAKQSFPIKDTEFNIFHDYMVCLGIAKLIFFPNKDEIKSFVKKKSGFFSKFYSLFLKS